MCVCVCVCVCESIAIVCRRLLCKPYLLTLKLNNEMICRVWGPCPLKFWKWARGFDDIVVCGGRGSVGRGQCCVGVGRGGRCGRTRTLTKTKNFHTLIYKHTSSWRRGAGWGRWGRRALLLPVVAELDGGAVEDAAEGDWLNFPVGHGVAEEADAGVHGLLAVEAGRAEVACSHGGDLVGVEVDHLEEGFE